MMQYKDYPKIESNLIEFLWYDDYYDGPLSGLCEYNGAKYYYFWVDLVDGQDINIWLN